MAQPCLFPSLPAIPAQPWAPPRSSDTGSSPGCKLVLPSPVIRRLLSLSTAGSPVRALELEETRGAERKLAVVTASKEASRRVLAPDPAVWRRQTDAQVSAPNRNRNTQQSAVVVNHGAEENRLTESLAMWRRTSFREMLAGALPMRERATFPAPLRPPLYLLQPLDYLGRAEVRIVNVGAEHAWRYVDPAQDRG